MNAMCNSSIEFLKTKESAKSATSHLPYFFFSWTLLFSELTNKAKDFGME